MSDQTKKINEKLSLAISNESVFNQGMDDFMTPELKVPGLPADWLHNQTKHWHWQKPDKQMYSACWNLLAQSNPTITQKRVLFNHTVPKKKKRTLAH